MGFLEDIDAMDISDEQKTKLKAAHLADVEPLRADRDKHARDNKRDKVEEEVKSLAVLFSDDEGHIIPQAIPAMKFVRRLYLSDTDADPAQEPEAVLLADHELGLSGEQATGAHASEGITAAGAVRKFIELLPTQEKEGKLRMLLSDVALSADDHGRESGSGAEGDDKDKDSKAHRASLEAATGLEIPERKRTRYSGGRPKVAAGGGS